MEQRRRAKIIGDTQLCRKQMGLSCKATSRKVQINPFRSDNNIKNHFFSRIRMALRHLLSQVKGKIIPKKKIQNSTVYRLVSLSDEAFNLSTSWSH